MIIEKQSKFTISNKWFLLFNVALCFAYFFAPDISTKWKYFNNGSFHPLYESLSILGKYIGFYFYPLIILLSFIFFKLTSIYKLFTPKNLRRKIDYKLIRLPILSDIILKFSLSNFTRNLSILTESGIPLEDSLNSSEHEEDNISIKRIIRNMSYKISNGYSFSKILEEENIFPKFFKDSLKLGEETGCLPYILEQLADFYDSELYYSLNKWQQNFQRFFDFTLIGLSVIILNQLVKFIFVYRWLF